MNIVIFGAGRVGRALNRILEGKRFKVTIVDENRAVCDEVAGETNAAVICGDVSDPKLLEELKLDKTDFVFAVTGSEETNFLVSVYARHMNARRVISRASEARYSRLMEKLGVIPLIPETTLARELANAVLNPMISMMLDPSYSNVEMFEKEVAGPLVDKTVKEANEKNDFAVISIIMEGKFVEPKPDFVLKEGMTLVVVKHNV
ncbi:TrkA family potassium uptake protein [Candidatus Micrarchaeota archaeon]|nr:TrkA family potassium uptake protein [Candidatus Micrarchaeota archaeon]